MDVNAFSLKLNLLQVNYSFIFWVVELLLFYIYIFFHFTCYGIRITCAVM